jgi:hypothetical protein
MGSEQDEAWLLLSELQQRSNPLAVSGNIIRYLFAVWRKQILRYDQVFKIHHATSWKTLQDLNQLEYLATCIAVLWPCAYLAFVCNSYVSPGKALLDVFAGALVWYGFVLMLTKYFEAKFYFTALKPARRAWYLARAVPSVLSGIAMYLFRNSGWSKLLAIAMGLEDYPDQLPRVTRLPDGDYVPARCAQFELPKRVLRSVSERQHGSVGHYLQNGEKTFSELVANAADLNSILEKIGTERLLIHSAYYTDPECIEEIAKWIAAD